MTIKITLEFATPAEAKAALAALDSADSYRADDSARRAMQERRDAVKAAKVKPPKDEAMAPAEKPSAPEVADTPEVPEVSYPQVQAAILKVANTKGRDAALALLEPFNVKAGKELKPEQYVDALAAFNKALEN